MSDQQTNAKATLSLNAILGLVLLFAIMLWAVRWDILRRIDVGSAHASVTSHAAAPTTGHEATATASPDQVAYEAAADAGVNWQQGYVKPANMVREVVDVAQLAADTSTAQATPAPAAAAAIVGDAAAGAKVFNKCKACHTTNKGDKHKTGPNLWGVYGHEAGSTDYGNYSDDLANWGQVWDDAHLNTFLEKPKALFAKTRMSFAGLKDAQDRADVIAYLATLKD